MRALPGPAAAVTHGGITIDLLRDLLDEDALPPSLLAAEIPPCAVTAVDDLNAVMIASVSHLALAMPQSLCNGATSGSAGRTKDQG
jgi:hypothetical protein